MSGSMLFDTDRILERSFFKKVELENNQQTTKECNFFFQLAKYHLLTIFLLMWSFIVSSSLDTDKAKGSAVAQW